MTTVYVKFQASGERAGPKDCTSALPPNTAQSIVMSGLYEGKATNLMVLNGVTADIEQWIRENDNKVKRITEAEGDAIGQAISPAGVYRDSEEPGGVAKHSYSGIFTMVGGQNWQDVTYVYLHSAFTGGDEMDPVGIVNDGIDSFAAAFSLRHTDNPASDLYTINKVLRIAIRDMDHLIVDMVKLPFTSGTCGGNYTTTTQPGHYALHEEDFDVVILGGNHYKIKIVGDSNFKVYRNLSA